MVSWFDDRTVVFAFGMDVRALDPLRLGLYVLICFVLGYVVPKARDQIRNRSQSRR